jgi:transcriptional antiterminator NusG
MDEQNTAEALIEPSLDQDDSVLQASTDLNDDTPQLVVSNVDVVGSSADDALDFKAPKIKKKSWYIIHTYSGHENKVKTNLERRIESMSMQHKIFRVESPQKTVTKLKEGKRIEKDEKLFPGYVLVEMIMDDDSWHVVRHTPGVTKFVGTQKRPIPAKEAEIRRILGKKEQDKADKPKLMINLKSGDLISITGGPFTDFEGTVSEIFPDREKLKATVSIFGRETPVELSFNQIIKL